MKTIMGSALLALGLLLSSCAGDDTAQADRVPAGEQTTAAVLNTDDPNVMKISVPTMQCESCAKTITNGIKEVPSASDVSVDVDSKTVFVKVANNTPETRMEIEKAIAGVGYSTPDIQRDQAAYDKLPDCCKEGGAEMHE